jgi:uncharacterized protein (UPF0332 family)/predicted nucleotidyltransferase
MTAPAARPATGLRDDPKLARIADALRETFGVRLVSALLFGSRARGDHRQDSDYDVAVFLEDYEPIRDRDTVRSLRDRLGEDAYTLQFWPFAKNGLAERTTLMFNIRNEGVPLPGFGWPPVIAPPIVPDEGPMKPETTSLLAGSDRELAKARKILGVDEPEAAARDAYFAVLFAVRALIFEVRNVAPKTHSGAASLFAEIAVKPGLLSERYSATLSQGLDIRMDVDYEPLPKTTQAQATEYVERAAEFVGAVKRLIEPKA